MVFYSIRQSIRFIILSIMQKKNTELNNNNTFSSESNIYLLLSIHENKHLIITHLEIPVYAVLPIERILIITRSYTTWNVNENLMNKICPLSKSLIIAGFLYMQC